MAYDADSTEGKALAEQLMRQHSEMEAERSNLDTLYQRIAEVVSPDAEYFTAKNQVQGQLRGEKVFDTTPGLALDRFSSAIGSYLVPDSDQWHGLQASDLDLREDEEIKEYLEASTNALFAARYRPKANFSANMNANFRSMGAFGPWCMFVDEALGDSLRYRSLHLSEVYFGENHQGLIDRVHRGRFELKAYQVEQRCNDPNPAARWIMPECVRKALEGKKQNATFDFLHCVYPNERQDARRGDHRGMAFASHYICATDNSIVNESGYRTMPYAVGRYMTGPRETYGRSPAMTVLRDILMLNEMNKTAIRVGQLQSDPPFLISEEGSLTPFSLRPGALNYGYITEDGKPLAQSLRPEGDLAITLEMIQDRRKAVNDAFMLTLFQILVDNPDKTATEALLRAQEKGQILGPAMSRQQDAIGMMIERELDILAVAGQLPPMPKKLRDAGAGVVVEFKAPVNKLQKTDAAVGILRTIEALTPMANIDPTVLDVIEPMRAARIIADANGAPPSALRTTEEMEAIQQSKKQQADVETLIKGAPAGAAAIKNLAQAQATAGNVPQPIPQVQPQ